MGISSRLTLALAGMLLGGLPAHAAVSVSQIPLSKNASVPPNVVLLMDTSGSMAERLPGSQETRIAATRRIAKALIENNASGVRFGLFRLDGSRVTDRRGNLIESSSYNGARLIQPVGASTSALLAGVDALEASGSTPVAEALYEVTRYYRGMSSAYHSGVTYQSPLQYRCQPNYTIMLTDGEPQYDSRFPSDDPDAQLLSGSRPDEHGQRNSLPNWDNKAPERGQRFSDGPRQNIATVGDYLYVDDIALFAWDLDVARTLGSALHAESSRERRRLRTYTVGFTTSQQMLEDAAEYGRGQYYTADDAAQLQSALERAISAINDQSGAAASTTANSSSVGSDTRFYQAEYDPRDWSGRLLARRVGADGSLAATVWDTRSDGVFASAANRDIFTWSRERNRATPFTWNNLDGAVQTALASGADASLARDRLDWLRGERSGEDGSRLRQRRTLLGDVINANLLYMGTQDYGFERLGSRNPQNAGDERGQSSYRAFLQSKASRTPVLFAGANDGMLHAFDAETGRELFAFVPRGVAEELHRLTRPDYGGGVHRYYVDGGLTLSDAFIDGRWRTLLVGSLGAGGRSVFALDVTDPDNFSASDVLWEYHDADLGLTFGTPQIGPLANGRWGVLFGNGYNSDNHRAMLYVLDAASGELLRKLDTGAGDAAGSNGLSAPAALPNAQRIVQTVYAGDLLGNLWKFDLSASNPANWDIPLRRNGNNGGPRPLFRSADGQPITAKPTLGAAGNDAGLLIYFGSGRYLGEVDKSDASLQAFYAVLDTTTRSNNHTPLRPTDLFARSMRNVSHAGGTYRQVDAGSFSLGSGNNQYPGWYLPLKAANAAAEGERVIYEARLRYDRVIFVTAIPSQDPCVAGGKSWLMEVSAQSGARLPYSVFDLDGDGDFDADDGNDDGPLSGIPFEDGILGAPSIISAGEHEYKYMGSTSGKVEIVNEQGGFQSGRQSWLQLR
ncbi:PilC/PilY family type IV pilus protein [Pseudomonas stutzeri]|nr:PilC/PilY family type IV pilus protein [Stutzerimonas stutzeri]